MVRFHPYPQNPFLWTLYEKIRTEFQGEMPQNGPPAPFDHIDIPDGLLGDFMESVDLSVRLRQAWEKLPESTAEVILWRVPSGRVFRETIDPEGNLRLELVNV